MLSLITTECDSLSTTTPLKYTIIYKTTIKFITQSFAQNLKPKFPPDNRGRGAKKGRYNRTADEGVSLMLFRGFVTTTLIHITALVELLIY